MNFNSKEKETYWQERAEQRLINAENLTSDMLSDLRKTYEQAIKSVQKEINAFYGKYSTETGLSLEEIRKRLDKSELKEFKKQLQLYYDEVKRLGGYSKDTKQYLRELSAKAYISRLEELQANIRWEVENLYRTQQLRIFEVLSKGYEDTYYRANFDVQQGVGFAYSFTALNTRAIQKAVTQKWQGSNFSNRIWNDKVKLIDTLNQTIPQGIALGQNPRKVARNIAKTMETKFSNAERLARTEMNHICNDATKDAYKETPEVLQQYKVIATLDNRTSEICQNQDNKVYKMSEWEEGVTAPPFHPNCFRDDTEVYTKDGWKLFKDCTLNDEFLSLYVDVTGNGYNIKEFVKPKKIIKYQCMDETLYHFENDKIDLFVTKNHYLYANTFKQAVPQLIMADTFVLLYKTYKIMKDFTHRLFFLNEKLEKIDLDDLKIKEVEHFNEMVYCVELERFHTLLVRRNGKICWCGNCRSTTVPYFADVDLSDYTRLVTDYSTGKSYFVSANLSYTEWKNSLSQEQQKYFIADKKIRQQHNADKEQLNNYRKIQTIANKNGDGYLFNGMPTKLQQWQELKYLEPDKYAIYRDNYQKYKNSLK